MHFGALWHRRLTTRASAEAMRIKKYGYTVSLASKSEDTVLDSSFEPKHRTILVGVAVRVLTAAHMVRRWEL